MALPTNPDLSAVQAEFNCNGLVDCSIKAGISQPYALSKFSGLSSSLVVFDAGTFDASVSEAYQTSGADGIARVSGGDVELGGEGSHIQLPEWGKCAIDLSGVSGYSNMDILVRVAYNSAGYDTYLAGKFSNTQFDVQDASFGTNYDFKETDSNSGGNLTTSFQTFTYSIGAGTYLNLCGRADTGSASSVLVIVDISKITFY